MSTSNIPDVCEDDGDVANAMCANFGEGESHVRYAMDSRKNIRLLGIYSDGEVSGRAMVTWLKSAYSRPILVDEVATSAVGFWEKMLDEGLITDWSVWQFSGKTIPMPAYEAPQPASKSVSAGPPWEVDVMPILAYHGTNAPEDFDVFEYTEDYGYHFGPVAAANKRMEDISDEDDPESIEHMRIIPCWLDIERPLRLIDCHTWGPRDTMLALKHAGVLTGQAFDEVWEGGYFDQEMFREVVERAGYDSVVYGNLTELGGDSYMVLNPDHIRFALIDLGPVARPRARCLSL